jgi:hypothetical protein
MKIPTKYSAFSGAIIANFILYGLFALLVTRLQKRFPWNGFVGRAILAWGIKSGSSACILIHNSSCILIWIPYWTKICTYNKS